MVRPGGRWAFSVTHPVRWAFPDDPGAGGLTATRSYFDRRAYVEQDESGVATYVEHHRTLGDLVRALTDAGWTLRDLIEPEWPPDNRQAWGGWSPLRGQTVPGTALLVCDLGSGTWSTAIWAVDGAAGSNWSGKPGGVVSPTKRFTALDGYRAVAAVTVVVFHVLFLTGENIAGTWMGNLASRLDVAVALFFLLSGFLLYRPWAVAHLSPHPRERGPRVTGYLWHRALRILPAYWVLVVVALLTTLQGQGSALWLTTLTMTEVYRNPLPTGLEQTWSLAAEVVFYLLLPVFAVVLLRPGRRTPRRQLVVELVTLGCLAVLGVGTQGLVESGWPWMPTLAGSWFIAYLAWFSAGMAMAVVHAWVTQHPGRLREITDEIGHNWGSCWALAAVLLVLTLTPIAGSHASASLTPFEAMARNVFYCLVASAFLFPWCVRSPARRDGRADHGGAGAGLPGADLVRHLLVAPDPDQAGDRDHRTSAVQGRQRRGARGHAARHDRRGHCQLLLRRGARTAAEEPGGDQARGLRHAGVTAACARRPRCWRRCRSSGLRTAAWPAATCASGTAT